MAMASQLERCGTGTKSKRATKSVILRYEDPLGADRADDVEMRATRRAICRVALIASEAATRFQRDGSPCDPMAWMLAPRRLFGGSPAIEACLERVHFSRALLLHGLGMGMDADPGEIDDLLAEDAGGATRAHMPTGEDTGGEGARGPAERARPSSKLAARRIGRSVDVSGPRDGSDGVAVLTGFGRRRLYSATVVYNRGSTDIVAFHASFAHGHDEMFERLRDRFGGEVASVAEVRVGFDVGHPLLPRIMAEMLTDAEGWPDDGRSIDLDVTFERCIRA